MPNDPGIAAVGQILEGTPLSGMERNEDLMGAWAMELLVARSMHQALGIPVYPRIEMVETQWIAGQTPRSAPPIL